MIAIGSGMGVIGDELWIVQKHADIGMQSLLIALERQDIIAASIDDLARDGALAMASAVTIAPLRDNSSRSFGIAVISFDLPSTAIWPRTSL